jgi:hypothetical protein
VASDHLQPWQDNQGHSMFPMVPAVLDAGATPFMHFPQQNPLTAIDFYRTQVLPRLH